MAGLGVSEVLSGVLPGLPQLPTAMAVVGGCTLLALLNIRVNAWITGLFLLVEVATLVVVSACGLIEARRSPLAFLTDPVAAGAGGLTPATFTRIGLAASIAIFAFNGYGAAVYFGEEMHQAPKRMRADRDRRRILLAGAPAEGWRLWSLATPGSDLRRLERAVVA